MPDAPLADPASADPPTDGLNPDQLDAVVHRGGPLLVVAGAGSGKTRVLTHRIAHLIHEGVHPSRILAITFTNKAADEMRQRVAALVGPGRPHDVGEHVPLGVRADPARQRRPPRVPAPVLDLRPGRRRAAHRVRDPRPPPRRQAVHAPRRARADQPLEERAASAPTARRRGPQNIFDRKHADVYREYQARLRKAGAMDFDDLLVNTVRLLRDHPDVLEHYRERFEHILVDEYQDTNQAQNEIVLLLAGGHHNVTRRRRHRPVPARGHADPDAGGRRADRAIGVGDVVARLPAAGRDGHGRDRHVHRSTTIEPLVRVTCAERRSVRAHGDPTPHRAGTCRPPRPARTSST